MPKGHSLKEQYASTPLFGGNAGAVEALYEQYLARPESVPKAWRDYFQSLGDPGTEIAHSSIRADLLESSGNGTRALKVQRQRASRGVSSAQKQAAVSRLIQVYSLRGHQIADIDPLGLMDRPVPGVLKLDYLGLSEADMDAEFYTGGLAGSGNSRMKLRDIIDLLKTIYCGKATAEVAHMSRARERLWLRKRFEHAVAAKSLTDDERSNDPRTADERRGHRTLSAYSLCRTETFFPGGRREPHSDARRPHTHRRCRRRA